MNRAKQKGTSWESSIATTVRDLFPHARRLALAGNNDQGDVTLGDGIPVVIEAKNCAQHDLAGWLREVDAEKVNSGATIGLVWAKRRGKTSPLDGYVIMSGSDALTLLAVAFGDAS